jgi:hypothetical protein
MMWQVTKVGFASLTSRVAWRKLAQGIAILFLFTHQAWAGIVCHCQHENGAQMSHACCRAEHHSGSAVNIEQVGETSHSPVSCSEAGAPGIESQSSINQFGALSQSAMICCHDALQAEQNATISLKEPAPVIGTQPLVSPGSQAGTVFIHYNFHQLYRTRPLYLSFSCLLI